MPGLPSLPWTSASNATWTRESLWGGNVQADVPAHLMNCSLIREVPDNQEAYTVLPGDGQTVAPEALTFELLEYVTASTATGDAEAAAYHLKDILDPGEKFLVVKHVDIAPAIKLSSPTKLVTNLTIAAVESPSLPTTNTESPPEAVTFIEPTQTLSALLFLALVRLPDLDTDLLITWANNFKDYPVTYENLGTENGRFGLLVESGGVIIQRILESVEFKDLSFLQG